MCNNTRDGIIATKSTILVTKLHVHAQLATRLLQKSTCMHTKYFSANALILIYIQQRRRNRKNLVCVASGVCNTAVIGGCVIENSMYN